jgi:hypothetical protein
MAKSETDLTRLSADQLKQAMATGVSMGDLNALRAEGHTAEDLMEILDIMAEQRTAAEDRQGDKLAKAVAGASAPDRIPENKHRHPRISVFNPKGEFHARINPTGIERPKTTCETLYTGVLMEGDVDTNEEIELANAITKPGIYFCTQNDGTKFKVTVDCEYEAGTHDVISRKLISFDYKGKSRERPSKATTLREIVTQQDAKEPARASA